MRSSKHSKTAVEKTFKGKFISSRKGYGFVEVEGVAGDFFIPEKYTLNAFFGDEVKITLLPARRGKAPEAKVTEIIKHSVTKVVGSFEKNGSFGFVISDNSKIIKDIFIKIGSSKGAKDGDKVVCEILDYGTKKKSPEGIVTEILGRKNDPYIDIYSVSKSFDIPDKFPVEVINESDNIPSFVDDETLKGRLDYTDEIVITIDGDDSKDFDDAVSLKKDGEDYILGVHIADVTAYVKENTPLDKEAYFRSTSVYLLDVVYPMLPERLCNGICSLVEGEIRLTLSCIMRIDKLGKVVESKIAPSYIKSSKRMTYRGVNDILRGKKEENISEDLCKLLFEMKELSEILNHKRVKRGAIDFDIPESKIKLDKNGRALDVCARERGISERIIEEFMLIANESVASFAFKNKLPILYRTHDFPEDERIEELTELCALFNIKFRPKNGKAKPKDIQKLLRDCKGTEAERLMSTVALRTMQQAKYTNDNPYHFGLAADYYCHFTSPIRRYPDLLVHRVIKEFLKEKKLSKKRYEHYESFIAVAANQTSNLERRANECEREVDKLKKAEYIKKHIGEKFEGIISGVTEWGLYVTLPNTVEGLVSIASIYGDYYIFDEKHYMLVGEKTKKKYRLGDSVTVIAENASTYLRTVDFRLYK